ncbi:hypothetical protein [Caballeronia mineralivorans]|uniref:hypothetical protein n=1 Tax=Caballeronia mineralivorans TaxID=2010198 RepID=UPI0023F2FB70|nr:hypothetical protein [Caballeronia mineralivorans]MDB5788217.1 hypothetical protein [Caballeronia mineralivorans]
MSTSNVVPMTRSQDKPPSLKEVGSFIARLRRVLRQTKSAISRDSDKARRIRAEAKALKDSGNPFHAERIRKLKARAEKLDAHQEALWKSLRHYGYLLVDAAPQIDAASTLSERCDLLNVNLADRAGLTDADGVVSILFAHALEDSAERRGCEFNDGPLFHALRLVMMDFLDTPQGQAASNSLYEPGGMFEWMPLCSENPDGTLTRIPPALREARPSDAE